MGAPGQFINQIFTAEVGEAWPNQDVLGVAEDALAALALDDAQHQALLSAVRYNLFGDRSRQTVPNWHKLTDFESRATAFETGTESALKQLAAQIADAATPASLVFDAVLTVTSTGNLMPGLSYRIAHHLDSLVKTNSLFLDLGNVGCTGSLKAVNLAHSLNRDFKNILVVAVEFPTTLVDLTSTEPDVWQGNCTFGDGAAALWISSDPEQGQMALRLDELLYTQHVNVGSELIHWGYRDYYTFKLANDKIFNRSVQTIVADVLKQVESTWRGVPDWAIHPAGITLMMRLGKKLGLPKSALEVSTAHYRQCSNMSSVGILHILKEIAESAAVPTAINLLTMGAGFNVIYGQVRKER